MVIDNGIIAIILTLPLANHLLMVVKKEIQNSSMQFFHFFGGKESMLPWSWGLVRGSWIWGNSLSGLSMFSSSTSCKGRYASPKKMPWPMIPRSFTHICRYAPSNLLWAPCTKLNKNIYQKISTKNIIEKKSILISGFSIVYLQIKCFIKQWK